MSNLLQFHSPTPSAGFSAKLRREAGPSGIARLAQDSLALIRTAGHHLRGVVTLQCAPHPSGKDRATQATWWFHGWPHEEVQAAAQRLRDAWPAHSDGWQLGPLTRVAQPSADTAMPCLDVPDDGDLCLRFDTPLRFVCVAGLGLPVLVGAQFQSMVHERLLSVFGSSALAQSLSAPLQVMTLYGHLAWVGPALAGGARVAQFQGSLFLRGCTPQLVCALHQLQAWHLVAGRDQDGVVWRGAYQLRVQTGPWLDSALLKHHRMATTAHRLLSREDVTPAWGDAGRLLSPAELTERMQAQLRTLCYTPAPAQAFDLHRPGRGPRRVERLITADLLVQQHALQVLTPVVERLFAPCSYGFRPGRSRLDAIEEVRAALRDGYSHVLESDVADCFPSVRHELLLKLLDQHLLRADKVMRHLLRQAITQAWTDGESRHERIQGLAQGAPLSPLLTNLMLTALDTALDPNRYRYVRYADDFLVLARTKSDAQLALVQVKAVLGAAQLHVAPHKTRIAHVQAGFTFLGESFGLHSAEPGPCAVVAQRKPLVVTQPYLQLGVNGDALEVRREAKLVGVWPLRRLSQLLVLARANCSSALLSRCAQHDIPVAVMQENGKHLQVLCGGQRRFLEAQFSHGMWHGALSDSARLGLAKDVVDAKLNNQSQLVTQRRGHAALADTLGELRRQAHGAASTDQLRGYEGQAARQMFDWLRSQIIASQRTLFQAKRRNRGGPDALNALLNFLYFLLSVRVSGLVQLQGLNPYLGWLHDSSDNYETLVYDLMEPFRPFVDRVALRLINRLELRPQHFDNSTGQYRLCPSASAHVAERFEEAMGERIQGAVLRELLLHQVQSVQAMGQKRGGLWLFRWAPRQALATPAEPQWLTLDNS